MAVYPKTDKTLRGVNDPEPICQSSTAKPHHAAVVMCQAKRSVPVVKAVLPNIFGKLSLRNNRMSM